MDLPQDFADSIRYGAKLATIRRNSGFDLVTVAQLLCGSVREVVALERGFGELSDEQHAQLIKLYGLSAGWMQVLDILRTLRRDAIRNKELELIEAEKQAVNIARKGVQQIVEITGEMNGQVPECPVCKNSPLSYTIYANGGSWGRCGRESCVQWSDPVLSK